MTTEGLIQLFKVNSFYDNKPLALFPKKNLLKRLFSELSQTDSSFFSKLSAIDVLATVQKMECTPYAIAGILEGMQQPIAKKLAKRFIRAIKNETNFVSYLLFSDSREFYDSIKEDESIPPSLFNEYPKSMSSDNILSIYMGKNINWKDTPDTDKTVIGVLSRWSKLSTEQFKKEIENALESEPDSNPLYWGLTWAEAYNNKNSEISEFLLEKWMTQLKKCRVIQDEGCVIVDASGSQMTPRGIPMTAPALLRIEVCAIEVIQMTSVCPNLRVFLTADNLHEIPPNVLARGPKAIFEHIPNTYESPEEYTQDMGINRYMGKTRLGLNGIYIKRSLLSAHSYYESKKYNKPKWLVILSDSGDCEGYDPMKEKTPILFAEKQICYNVCRETFYGEDEIPFTRADYNPTFPNGWFTGLSSNLLEQLCFVLDIPNSFAKGGRLGHIF